MVLLQQARRCAAIEVTYTLFENMTADGRDRSLDYKITGFHVPKGSVDAQVLDALAPSADEIIIPKTSSSVFISTNIDYVLPGAVHQRARRPTELDSIVLLSASRVRVKLAQAIPCDNKLCRGWPRSR
jgi:nicotinamidase-related amidase